MPIEIAVIDSGINPGHSHVQGVAGGISFHLEATGKVAEGVDFSDELGHGTAIAGVIRERNPQAKIYAVKIFHQLLEAPAALLLAAMQWAIRARVNIIHLSLGTERSEYRGDLKQLCRDAVRKDIVIIAAARALEDQVLPAIFDEVIGVYWNHDCENGSLIYYPEKSVEFGAYGRPRALPGIPQELNFGGSSFAAAHVTAMAADILEHHPMAGIVWVKEMLRKKAKEDIDSNDEK
jgi:subtilisin family serine protease